MQGDAGVEESWAGCSMAHMYVCVYVYACVVNHVLEEAVSLEGQAVTGEWEMSIWGGGVDTMRPLDCPCWGTVEDLWRWLAYSHHFWALQDLGGPVTENVENMLGKLLGARASLGALGKIRHNWSKIENFIKSNPTGQLSSTPRQEPSLPLTGVQRRGAGVSIGHRGYSMVGGWVILTHGAPGRRQSCRHSSPLSLPSYLRIDPTGAKAETWCKLTGQTA